MRQIVTDLRVAKFVEEKIGRPIVPPYTAVGVESSGEIIGGVVLNHWIRTDINVTVAGSPKAWSREFISSIGSYVFEQLGCLRMTVITSQPLVISIACRMGGQIEGLMRNRFGPGVDGTVVGILKEDWKF